MSILAVYGAEDLQCPRRVLTHRQDIETELAAMGITLLPAEAPAMVGAQRKHECHGAPAYEQPEERIDGAQVFVCGALERRIERGRVRLCLLNASSVLLIALRAGDRLTLPAGLSQCMLPTPGDTCSWVDTAAAESDLAYQPVPQSALVMLAPLEV